MPKKDIEKKKEEYVIPWSIVFRDYSFWQDLAFVLMFMSLILAFILNLNVFLDPNTYSSQGGHTPIYVPQYLILLFVLFFLVSIIVGTMHSLGKSHAVCNWILDNVNCPVCGGKIKSCSYRGWTLYTEYNVQCSKCKKTSSFGTVGVWFGNKIVPAWKVPTFGDLVHWIKQS